MPVRERIIGDKRATRDVPWQRRVSEGDPRTVELDVAPAQSVEDGIAKIIAGDRVSRNARLPM